MQPLTSTLQGEIMKAVKTNNDKATALKANTDKVAKAKAAIDKTTADKLAGKAPVLDTKAKAVEAATKATKKASITVKPKAKGKAGDKVITKQAGSRRVASNTSKSEGSAFMNMASLAPNAGDTIKAAREAIKALTIAQGDMTPLGRKLVGPNPAAGNIDMWLLETAKTGDINLQSLYKRVFDLVSTTSRVEGMTPQQKVAASYNRIVEHLACIKGSDRYSLPSMVKMGYTQGQANTILNGIAPLAQAVRLPFMQARKVAVKAAKASVVK